MERGRGGAVTKDYAVKSVLPATQGAAKRARPPVLLRKLPHRQRAQQRHRQGLLLGEPREDPGQAPRALHLRQGLPPQERAASAEDSLAAVARAQGSVPPGLWPLRI